MEWANSVLHPSRIDEADERVRLLRRGCACDCCGHRERPGECRNDRDEWNRDAILHRPSTAEFPQGRKTLLRGANFYIRVCAA